MMKRLSLTFAASALLGGCAIGTAALPPGAARRPAPPAASAQLGLDDPAPDSMRWTYGSGEAAAASIQAWRNLADFAIAAAARNPPTSVLMGLPGVTGGVAATSCAGKPTAVVLDIDETVILNRGYEYWLARGHAYSPAMFDRWASEGAAQAVPVPGAVTGIRRLRAANIAVVYNTNRPVAVTAATIRALETAGVGGAVHGDTLFLTGDDALGGNKDGRRKIISDRFCVVALGGDNLGDFAETLNERAQTVQQRRARAARGDFAQLWGNGWFLIPNSAYGAWQKGTIGDVFPPDARWEPGQAAAANEDK